MRAIRLPAIRALTLWLVACCLPIAAVLIGEVPVAQAADTAGGSVSFTPASGSWDTVFNVAGVAPGSGSETPCVTDPTNQSTLFGLFVATPGNELQAPVSDVFISSYAFGGQVLLGQTLSEARGVGISFAAEENFADFGDASQLQTATGTFSIGVMCYDDLGVVPIAAYWKSITFDGSGNWTISGATTSSSTSATSSSASTTSTESTSSDTSSSDTTSTDSTSTDTTSTDTTSTQTTLSTGTTTETTTSPGLTPIVVLTSASGQPLGDDPTLHPGDHVTVLGSGFEGSEPVGIVAHSTPITLATAYADNGAFSETVTVPAALTNGPHALTITGVTSGVSVSLPFKVTGSAVGESTTSSSASAGSSTSTGSSTSAGATASTSLSSAAGGTTFSSPTTAEAFTDGAGGSQGPTLAATGGPYLAIAAAGLALLVLGGVGLVLGRTGSRSRRAH